MSKLSAVVIAKDEERKIEECFKSVKWADEVILIDTGSTDKTIDIANKHGVSVTQYEKGGYSDWRNKGLAKASGDWILYVDADERVTPELRKEISELINKTSHQYLSFAIPRRNIILGREMKHGGWWPDYAKRLYKKNDLVKWEGDLHEEPVVKGEMGHLENPFIHEKHDNLGEMVEKTNERSEIEAKLMYDANHPPMNIFRFITAMAREFWLRMIKKVAFLDGTEGIIYALYQVYSKFISYAKLWEMQLNSSK